jgi:enamine deaminase RidA (YjgF/YER057c/UK114 family)
MIISGLQSMPASHSRKGGTMPSQHINPEALSRSRGYSQVRQVWRNIEAAVKAAGGTLQNVVKTTTYITNIQYATAVRKVREELFQSSNPPTSTLLVVAGLAGPDYMVEIEAMAVVD